MGEEDSSLSRDKARKIGSENKTVCTDRDSRKVAIKVGNL